LTKSLNWYFLAITMYFLYGESVIYYFKHILLVDKVLLPFATHHRFISFMMYIFGEQPPYTWVWNCANGDKDSCFSWARSKRVIIGSNSCNSHGPIWHST
jgi:hypothetical protein